MLFISLAPLDPTSPTKLTFLFTLFIIMKRWRVVRALDCVMLCRVTARGLMDHLNHKSCIALAASLGTLCKHACMITGCCWTKGEL